VVRWTDTELEQLIEAREQKISFAEIQKRFFPYRSEKSITEKAFREGLQRGYTIFSSSEKQRFYSLLSERKNFREIQKAFPGVSMVALRLKAMRLKKITKKEM